MSLFIKRLSLPLAVIVSLALAPAGVAEAKKKRTCKSRGSHTVISNSKARVFYRNRSYGGARYYGCLRSHGRKWLLTVDPGEADFDWAFKVPRLKGRYVAFAERYVNSAGEGGETLQAFDLRRGRKRLELASQPSASTIDPTEWSTTDLVLTATGWIAWISDSDLAGGAVQSSDSSGLHLLDTGNINPTSLRRRGRVVSWVKDGMRSSARLS